MPTFTLLSTLYPCQQDREILHAMLAAIVNITEIEFEEDNSGIPVFKDIAPLVHGKHISYTNINKYIL